MGLYKLLLPDSIKVDYQTKVLNICLKLKHLERLKQGKKKLFLIEASILKKIKTIFY